jgi:integrase
MTPKSNRRAATCRLQFSERTIEKFNPPSDARMHVYDAHETGLGLRCEGGKKSFFWFRKIRGVPTFRPIGVFPSTSADKAITQAKEWNAALDRWRCDGFKGENPLAQPDGEMTLAELFERYIEKRVRKSSRPERAERELRYKLGHFKAWLPRKLSQIDKRDVRELHERLTKTSGPIEADRTVQLIRTVYNYALSETVELFTGPNPAVKVELNGDRERDRFLQPPELLRLEEALRTEPNPDWRDFVELALATGLRKRNVLGMKWEWIDDQHWVVTVPRTSTKSKKPYVLPLTPRAVAVLKRRAQRAASPEWVFPSSTSASGHLEEPKRAFQALLERAKISNCTVHDLRRTFASYQSISGQSLQAIAKTLGHSNTASTEIYAKLNTEATRASLLAGADAMQQAVRGARKKPKLLNPGR